MEETEVITCLVLFASKTMSLFYCLIIAQFFVLNNALSIRSAFRSDRILDAALTAPQLIKKYSYPLEIHHVVTEDGYVLELHRIPHGKENKSNLRSNPPVLLLHGLAGSSADWILMGPERGLGYILADEGFDVWLGNNRGNIYSKNHTLISTSHRKFWNFSYHELGVYDLPASIDYILAQTKYDKLFYIGHSQGTTQFWVMMSERPSYNSKISLMIALAPVAYTSHMRGLVTKLADVTYVGVWIGETFGYPELRSRSIWEKMVSNIICRDSVKSLCTNVIFFIAGLNKTEYDTVDTKIMKSHIPAGGSWKQIIHFGQGYIHKDLFRQFDYNNNEKNYETYNSYASPEYDLSRVKAPIAAFSSEADVLADTQDVEHLIGKLNNIVHHEKFKDFTHYDFLWGKHSTSLLFQPILKLLRDYEFKNNLNNALL
ncbi:gastric triacylglycerol lipase [Calliopsis andreniformis]|uniref:gastric triacylglycerol lipase n=1 Tax=Calliopsis andreniformis TaxID=337506 RepID=UPI003FCDB7F9